MTFSKERCRIYQCAPHALTFISDTHCLFIGESRCLFEGELIHRLFTVETKGLFTKCRSIQLYFTFTLSVNCNFTESCIFLRNQGLLHTVLYIIHVVQNTIIMYYCMSMLITNSI